MSTLSLQPESLPLAAPRGERDAVRGDRIFFPGLNFVRAYAALGVVVWHMRQLMMLFRVPIAEPLYDNVLYRIFPRGEDGVMLFFVLSGFLITYLLLAEQRRTGTVDIGKFYVRRVLRIWPLYFLVVLIGFWFLSQRPGTALPAFLMRDDETFLPRLACYLVLLPNVAAALWPGAIPIGHLWSIGVEEQFYLLWPALMKWFGRSILWIIFAVIAAKATSYWAESYFFTQTRGWHRGAWAPTLHDLFQILRLLRLDCMAIGGLAAYVAFRAPRGSRLARWLYHPLTALLSLAPAIYIVVTMWRPYTQYGSIGHAAVYAVAILCAGANPNLPRWFLLALAPIDFLGRISYGLYMYHVPVMFCLLRYLQKHRIAWHTGFQYIPQKHGIKVVAPPVASVERNLALLLVVTAIAVAVATLSFYAFERPFLRIKRRYTVVKSGSPEQT